MTNAEKVLQNRPKKWIINLLFFIILLLAFLYSFYGSKINPERLRSFGAQIGNMISEFKNISFDLLLGIGTFDFTEGILYLGLQTVAIAFVGTLFGAILSFPFGFLASQNIAGKKTSQIGVVILVIIRVFPEIVLAIILIGGFGMTALTCVIAIAIHSIGMLGKLFSEIIDNMDNGPIEALDAVGANIWQKIRFGIIPQIIPDLASVTLYRFDINIRAATVLGVVGSSAGFGVYLLLAANSGGAWDFLNTIMVAIIFFVLIVDFLSGYLRKKLI